MKKNLFLAVLLLIGFGLKTEAQLLKKIKDNLPKKNNNSNQQPGQQQSAGDKFESKDFGHVKYKLEEGEKLMNGEECVFFNGSFEQFQFITQKKDGKYYFHNHDRISGPFDKPPTDSLKDCQEKQPQANQRDQKNNPSLAKYQTVDNASTTPFGIKIGSKTYGPYNMITNLYVSPDESRFYAMVMMIAANGNDMEYYLVSNKNKVKLPGLAGGWMISPDGNVCAIPMTQSQMNGKTEPTMNPSEPVTLIFDDGHKKGPFADFYANQYSMLTNGGAYVEWKHTDPKNIYVDGKPTLKFSKDVNNFNSVILNDNATAGVFFDYGDLYFSDGTTIEREAIRPHLAKENGKTFVRWMALDNEGNIYECKKEI